MYRKRANHAAAAVFASVERNGTGIGLFLIQRMSSCVVFLHSDVGEPLSVSIHWAPSCFGFKCRQEIHSQGFQRFYVVLQCSVSPLGSVLKISYNVKAFGDVCFCLVRVQQKASLQPT